LSYPVDYVSNHDPAGESLDDIMANLEKELVRKAG